jgi:hypothetical protein
LVAPTDPSFCLNLTIDFYLTNGLVSIQIKTNLGQCIEVRWLKYDAEFLKELEYTKEEFDAGVQRRTTIYKEYNPEICKAIVELAFPA